MSDLSTSDPLISLRLSWPKAQALQTLRDQHHAEFTRACSLLKKRIDGCQCATLDKLERDVAMSLANDFLGRVIDDKAKESITLDHFVAATPAFLRDEWLADVFWTASCIQKDDAANRELINVIEGEVRRKLALAGYNDEIIDEVVDDLPAHLYFTIQKGFNRGRPRLAQFSGKSTLVVWLKVVALNLACDAAIRASKCDEASIDSGLPEPVAPDTASGQVEVMPIFRTAARNALGRLLRELSDLKKSQPASKQFDFFVLRIVQGKRPKETAELLGVGLNRLDELAHAVWKRLLKHLDEVAPGLGTLVSPEAHSGEASSNKSQLSAEYRKLLEQMLQQLFEIDDLAQVGGSDDE